MFRRARVATLLLLSFVMLAVSAQAATAAPQALINASTVSGGTSSQEARIAVSLGYTVTIVSDSSWGALTASQFGAYDLLIAGDPSCGGLPAGLVSSAPVYGPVVLGTSGGRTAAGNRVVVGTDPVYHDAGSFTAPNARGTVIRTGIAFAGRQPGTTGMYFDASCAGSQSLPIVNALSAGSGAWTINGRPPCGGAASVIASNPSFADLTSASLQGWGCSVHETFPTFKSDWSALAVATDTASKPTCGIDPSTGASACGEAYVLIAGSGIVVTSGSISVTPLTGSDPAGGDHTVTANVTSGGAPLNGQSVTFSITGQNAGATGVCVPVTCKSGADGNVSFTYQDSNGAGDDTIKASFTDARGSLQAATAQQKWTARVAVAPTAALDPANDMAVGEGTTHTYRFTTNATATAVATSCGSDGTKVAGSDTATSFECSFADGPASTTVSVTPSNAAGTSDSQSVSIANVAPTARLDGGNATAVDEGSTHHYAFTTSDVGDDTVSVTTSCGSNGTKVAGSDTATGFDCSFADGPASTAVSVTPTDSDGAQGITVTQTVSVANVAPTATVSGSETASEGSTHHYSFTTNDVGDDTVTVETSCGGNGTKVLGSDTATGFDCFNADGPATSTVSVVPTDSDGATGDPATRDVVVSNVAPTVKLDAGNPGAVTESKSERTFGYSISDPGVDTVASVSTSCGSAGEKVAGSDAHTDSSGSFRCVFANGPATSKVSVSATDSDGDTGNTDTQDVSVSDPKITAAGSPVSGVEAASFSGQKVGSFTDPTDYSTASEYTASINWGDGSSSAGTITKTGPGTFDVTGSHTYAEEGSFAVTLTVTDADNAANTDTAGSTAKVTDAPIHAQGVSLITTPAAYSGPVATFSDEASGPKADFSATVNWGDGSSSAGTISGPDAGGKFTVSGSHTYATTGPFTVTVKVVDVGGSTDTARTDVLVYAFATGAGGSFTISDKQAVQGSSVTYWGAQWERANPFSSGLSGSSSFKGYIEPAASKVAPRCNTTWTSSPGDSSNPPSSVPAYMAVVVASKESKSGSTISGDVKKIVVVKTDAGYDANPGNAGTGKIVGSVCG